MEKPVRTVFTAVSLSIFVMLMFLPMFVRAVNYTVGVKVGDWVKYGQFTVAWNGNGTEPEQVTEEKKVNWARMDVLHINGTVVIFKLTTDFNNGTQVFENEREEVANGQGMTLPGFYFLIAPNLESGDHITNSSGSPTINQTTTGTYAGATRSINLLQSSSDYLNQTLMSNTTWDQNTGVMVELYTRAPYSSPGGYMEVTIRATETNLWSTDVVGFISNNLVFILIAVIIGVMLMATAFFLRRKKTPPTAQAPKPDITDEKPA